MEQYANKPQTTLSAAITGTGSTSCTVTSGATFPSSGTFRVLIDTEIIKVTGVSGTTWTIARGDGGTTAATHGNGSTIYGIVTKESLDALVSILGNGTEVSNRRVLNIIGGYVADNSGSSRADIDVGSPFETAYTKPSASFVWVNQGTASVTTNSRGAIFVRAPAAGGNAPRGYMIAVPATPYTITAKLVGSCYDVDYNGFGIGWADTGNSKFHAAVCYKNNIQVNRLTYSAYSSTDGTANAGLVSQYYWFQAVDNGTNRSIKISIDGENWMDVWSGANTTWITPTHVGVYVESNNGTYDAAALLASWKQT